MLTCFSYTPPSSFYVWHSFREEKCLVEKRGRPTEAQTTEYLLLEKRLELAELQLKNLKTELESINKSMKTIVAFSATLQTPQSFEFIGPFEADYTLKYGYVITNVGNAYNPATGVFTAPVRGVYFFSFVLFNPQGGNAASAAKLMKNSEMVVSATDNLPGGGNTDSEDTTTNSVTLILDVSDRVYIEMHQGRGVYTDGNRRNSFSGHLLHAM